MFKAVRDLLLGKKPEVAQVVGYAEPHIKCDMYIDLLKIDVVCIERTADNQTVIGFFFKNVPDQTEIQEWWLDISDESHNNMVAAYRALIEPKTV